MEVVHDTATGTLEGFVQRAVGRGSHVVTDGWSGYRNLEDLGYEHEVHIHLGQPTVLDATQHKVHLMFSNLEAWLTGTFHGVTARYLGSYLREFVYRFNRRWLGERTFGFAVRRVMSGPWTPRKSMVAEATS